MMDLFIDTLRSLRAHALRFGLTAIGIGWGAFLLTYLSANMAGVSAHYDREMSEAGPRIIRISPGAVFKNRVGERGARQIEFEEEDLVSVETLREVEAVSPNLVSWSLIIRAGRRTKLFSVTGLGAEAGEIRNLVPASGRFLSPLDVERGARVAFLGHEVAKGLFGHASPLGRRVTIEGMGFRVIGVATSKADQLVGINGWDDWGIFIPYTTAQRWLHKTDKVQAFIYAPYTREQSWDTIDRTRALLGLHHDFQPDLDTALYVFNVQEPLKMIHTVLLGFQIFEIAAGVITLLVGAVGVMNIMLVVVGERTHEIGLRKAIGASRRDIFVQFLAEAVAVCGAAGVLGAALGVGASQLMARYAPPDGPLSSPPVLDPVTVTALAGSLIAVGIVAGVLPAFRASRIAPVEALRAP